jgi:hypothetical protein
MLHHVNALEGLTTVAACIMNRLDQILDLDTLERTILQYALYPSRVGSSNVKRFIMSVDTVLGARKSCCRINKEAASSG